MAVTSNELRINELVPQIARDLFGAYFVDDLAIYFRGRFEHHRETFTAGNKLHIGMGH